MSVQTTLPPAEACQSSLGCSLTDVLSLVEVAECRRSAARSTPNVPAATPGPSGGSPDGGTAIDLMSLLGRCLGNIDLIVRVLASFRSAGGADLARLELAVELLDFESVVEVAHRFKGAAGNVSAPGLRKIAVSMELLGRERNGPALKLALGQFRSEWEEFVRCADAFAPAVSIPATGPAGSPT